MQKGLRWVQTITPDRASHMDKDTTTADVLELIHLNQIAIRAAVEELSTWIRQRGSTNVHENAMTALQTLDTNAGAITKAIERLRE